MVSQFGTVCHENFVGKVLKQTPGWLNRQLFVLSSGKFCWHYPEAAWQFAINERMNPDNQWLAKEKYRK
jgi:hypothetical protein